MQLMSNSITLAFLHCGDEAWHPTQFSHLQIRQDKQRRLLGHQLDDFQIPFIEYLFIPTSSQSQYANHRVGCAQSHNDFNTVDLRQR